jgi:hypothetical protein
MFRTCKSSMHTIAWFLLTAVSTLRQTSTPPSDAFEDNTRETQGNPTYLLSRASADRLGVLVRELPKDPESGGCVGIEPPRYPAPA